MLQNPVLPYPKTTYAILEHYPETHTKMKLLVIFNELFIAYFMKGQKTLVHMKTFWSCTWILIGLNQILKIHNSVKKYARFMGYLQIIFIVNVVFFLHFGIVLWIIYNFKHFACKTTFGSWFCEALKSWKNL